MMYRKSQWKYIKKKILLETKSYWKFETKKEESVETNYVQIKFIIGFL